LVAAGDAGSIDMALLTELGVGSTENVEEPKILIEAFERVWKGFPKSVEVSRRVWKRMQNQS
jgi:hypothetical protein